MSRDLVDWLASTQPPYVARVDGPGATGVLEQLTGSKPGFLSRHPGDQAPPSGGWLWLHEAGIETDVVVELATLLQCGRVILTGPALGAGVPRPHFQATVQGSSGTGWTRLESVPRYRTRSEALQQLDAFSARLLGGGPNAALERLVELGRYEEAEREAFQEEPLGWYPLMLLARASEVRGRMDRARQLLVAARRRCPDSPGPVARLEWYQGQLQGQRTQPPQGIHQHRAWYDAWRGGPTPLRQQTTDVAAALLRIGPLRTPLKSIEGAAAMIRLGWFGFARRLHPTRTDPELTHRTVLDALELLRTGDVEGARDRLDTAPGIGHTTEAWGALWTAYRAGCAALLGDGPRVHRLTRQLLQLPPLPAQSLRPLLDQLSSAPAWERIRMATTVQEWTDGTCGAAPSSARPDEAPVLGHYQLDAPIGEGGMGRVWQATFVPTGRPVAVKTLRSQKARHIQLFLSEVDIVTRLDHPAIVSVLDHGLVHPLEAAHRPDVLSPNQPYLVMERVEGGSLADHVGQLSWPELKAVLLALLDALAYAHSRGVVHRDLKPTNVLVGTDRTIRLCDFGLAGLESGRIAGTPAYMAPEQFSGGLVDGRADLYAVGALAWTLACGLPPRMGSFEAIRAAFDRPLPAFEPSQPVPAQLSEWIGRLLAPVPGERFDSAAQAAASLLDLTDESIETAPTRSRWQAPATFLFETATLLGLESIGPLLKSSRTPGRRIRDLFRRDLPYRPRLPITTLLHRGDPPVEGREGPLGQLLEWMEEARERRQPVFACLQGDRGTGRSACAAAARRRLAMEGVFVGADPGDAPALIDAGTEPFEDWKARAEDKPWLVVWTRPCDLPAEVRTIELKPLNPVDMFWVVRARLPVEPVLALNIVLRALGNPGLALCLLQDLVDNPGVEAGPAGLRLTSWTLPALPRTRTWWARELEERDEPWRSYADVAALLGPDLRGRDFHRVCHALGLGDSEQMLPRLAVQAACWHVPPTLCEVVLQAMSEPRRRKLIEVASRITDDGPEGALRAAELRMPIDDDALPDLIDAIETQLARVQPVPRAASALLEAGLDAAGIPEGDDRRSLARLDEAVRQRRSGNAEGFEAVLAEAHSNGWFTILAWAARIDAIRLNDPALLGPMMRLAARTGNPYDRVTALVVATAVHRRNGLPWVALCERALERCRTKTPSFESSVRRSLSAYTGQTSLMASSDLSDPRDLAIHLHHCMRRKAYQEGWEVGRDRVDDLAMVRSGVGLLNLAAVAVGAGEAERAGNLAIRATLATGHRRDRRLLNVMQLLLLGLRADWPSRQWEDLARVTEPSGDRSIQPVIERLISRLPAEHPRRRTLERLTAGAAVENHDDTIVFQTEPPTGGQERL